MKLTFIYRTGCHLCEAMWAELDGYRNRPDLEFTAIDITGIEDLERRYGELIPVLAHEKEGELLELCQFFLDPEELDAYLAEYLPST